MQLVKSFHVGLAPTFMREEVDGGGGGDPMSVLDPGLPGGEAGGDPTPTPTPTPSFDPEALARAVGGSVAEILQRNQPKPEPKPVTLEEAKAALGFYEVDDAFMARFGNLETQKSALEEYRDGLVRYVYGIMSHMLKDRDSQIESRYNPALEFMQQHHAEQREARFNKAYEQLADPSFKPLIASVISHLSSSDASFKTKPEAEQFKVIAQGVETVIKATNPQFKLNPVAQAAKPGAAPGSIPVTTHGGGGGGNRGGGKAKLTGNPVIDFL